MTPEWWGGRVIPNLSNQAKKKMQEKNWSYMGFILNASSLNLAINNARDVVF